MRQQLGKVQPCHRRGRSAAFEPCEVEDLSDQRIQPIGFLLDPVERARQVLRILPQQPRRGVQARERRAQFMRQIVQQAGLGGNQGLELLRHAIEVAAQIRDFIAPAAHAGEHARVELALRRRVERPSADCGSAAPGTRREER